MPGPYNNTTLCVPRGGGSNNLQKAVVVDHAIGEIPNGHVLIQVDKFGWSANNVTYGLLGEDPHFRYFDFHSAPSTSHTSPKTHGVIPVWGFGSVLESRVQAIKVGERVFGYFPSAKYMLVEVDELDLNAHNFYAKRPHLPTDRRPYNQITRCSKDPLYNANHEDATMLYRPLFWTSFWAEDWLNSMDYRDAKQVVISSASSKTGFCLALAIRKRIEKTGKILQIVGLTSKSNLNFVRGLGLYDQVLLYDDLTTLEPNAGPYCYVDVAGNDSINRKILSHLGPDLSFGVTLGMSHVSETKSSIKDAAENDTKLEMFFMPEWLHVVRQKTSVKDIARRQMEGWGWIINDGTKWVNLETSRGDVLASYRQTLTGSIGPDRGLIFSLWDDAPAAKAKL